MKKPIASFVLPDLLKSGLKTVFCGTAAGPMSAAKGHYYAHPQNKFWLALHEAGFTPRRLQPHEYPGLHEWHIGLTDIAKYTSGLDKDLPPASLSRAACEDLRTRIARHQPALLAFTSLNAGRRFLGSKAMLGPQMDTIGSTAIWILPSPSPLAGWNWDIGWWKKLAATHAAA